jgi:urocanate hydratase
MVGQFDNQASFNRAAALGVANYGQMTAGGWMYIAHRASSTAPSTPS